MRLTRICVLLAFASGAMLASSAPVSALDDVICIEEMITQYTVKGPDGYTSFVHSTCVRWLWVPDKVSDTPSDPLPDDGGGIQPGNDEQVTCEQYAKSLDAMRAEMRGLLDTLPIAERHAAEWIARAGAEETIAKDLADRWHRSILAYDDVERIYLEQNELDATIEWENGHGATLSRPTIDGPHDINTSLPGGLALMRAWNGRVAAGSAAVAADTASKASMAVRDAKVLALANIRQRIEDLARLLEELRASEVGCE